MRVGTSYFTSKPAAVLYYAYEGAMEADIDRKIEEGLIHIGKPPLKPGELLSTIDNHARYATEKLITRAEYMADSANLHQAYYLEVAQHAGMNASSLPVSVEECREALKTDKHMNNISLVKWDARASHWKQAVAQVNIAKEGHCASSLSDCVCALKALARHLAEGKDA